MSPSKSTSNRTAIALVIYVAVIAVSVGGVWVALARLADSYASVQAAKSLLAQIEGRSPQAANDAMAGFASAPAGSPFLEGKTLTVAGAALLQRVVGAVKRIGGNTLSSQVDLQKADAKDGWIGLTVSCDVEQASLQQLLYDIEAGMPFLFIDQLVVQAPTAGVEESRMHVLLGVSAQWRGAGS